MAPKVLLLALISLFALEQILVVHATFVTDTVCVWGDGNCQINGNNLTLILNPWSGAAIKGTKEILYGLIDSRIKLIPNDSAAVVTTYYLSSPMTKTNDVHDEIDFEFLGNLSGDPYTIHTNLWVNGVGGREIQFKPWYNPTSDYHNYTIFWNPYMVVWSVDGEVFRVHKRDDAKGVAYPSTRPMRLYASIWNADDWACQGGRIKTNWTHQPFISRFLDYQDSVCLYTGDSSLKDCSDPSKWYFAPQYKTLSQPQIDRMNEIRKNIIYDYCAEAKKTNSKIPPEC